jgi:putative ABC transport system permease protein
MGWGELRRRLSNAMGRGKFDDDLDEEVRLHIELRAEKLRASGMSAGEAYNTARRQFGNSSQVRETSRELWRWTWIEDFFADLRYAWRGLGRSKAFTVVAVATLALGLGANAAIFSLVDAVLLKPLPYRDPDRLMLVDEINPSGQRAGGTSAATFLDWKAAVRSMHLVANGGNWLTMTGEGEPQRVEATLVTPDFMEVVGGMPATGRSFRPEESQPGNEYVVVLSHKFWQTKLAGDPNVIGRRLTLDSAPYTVIGILPADSWYDRDGSDVWMPLVLTTAGAQTRDFRYLGVLGRLEPGATIESARAEMAAIGARIALENPKTNKRWGATANRLADVVVRRDLRASLYVLLVAVAGVLLIGCVNLANLLLARSAAREREVQVRLALGAGRMRLVRQFLTESVLLSLLGACAGWALGSLLLTGIKKWIAEGMLPQQVDPKLDARVMGFMLALALLSAILFGLAPALATWRKDVAEGLREDSRGSTGGGGRQRVRSALIAIEVALAFMLVATAGVLIHSLDRLTKLETGIDVTNVLTMQLPRSMGRDTDGPRLAGLVRRMNEEVATIPGVREVAVSTTLPLNGMGFGFQLDILGRPNPDPQNRPFCRFRAITPDYFKMLRLRLRRGRLLQESDGSGSPNVVVVNETFVKKFFPDSDPIGQSIVFPKIVTGKREIGEKVPWEIVGVVSDELPYMTMQVGPAGYMPFNQSPLVGFGMMVRGQGDSRTLLKSIQAALRRVDPNQAVTDVKMVEETKAQSTAPQRMRTLILAGFAGLALVLAAVGIYGVVAYAVTQRTRELGIRAALGASRGSLVGLALRGSMTLAAAGLIAGVLGVQWSGRLVATLLFQTSPTEASTLALVATVLLGVALLASYLPARRAARVDPVIALRHE